MKIPEQSYSYDVFVRTCNELLKKQNRNLQIITLLFKNDNPESLADVFTNIGFSFNKLGDVIEISTKYNLYNTERVVYYYLVQHPKYPEIYYIITFNGVGDIYRTFFSTIVSIPNLYYLWLPPTYFDKLKSYILGFQNSYISYFHGKKVDVGKKDCKRPMFYRDIKYKGDDAKQSLEEMSFEYGVLPQAIEFIIPNYAKFKINKNGHYTLFVGDVEEFFEKIIARFIGMVIKDNREIEAAKLGITKKGELEVLDSKEVRFELEREISYEEFQEFISVMAKSNFTPYNIRLREGSVIFSGNIVDEDKGNIFSVTSNGKLFSIVPKYNSSYVSIIRFHRFLIEKIDQLTRIIYAKNGNEIEA